MINSLKQAGVPAEDIAKFIGERKPNSSEQDFEVWPDNWVTFIFFIELATQWRVVSGMAGNVMLGLDYPGVEAMMRIKNIPKKQKLTLFTELQIMEREALEVLNKPKEKED